ncbi:MAG TPA: CopG family transcriptional regulator [Coxiellaceae bacterium]|nr:CopG family transcriptional regulator [Coxiellaceae bacterium]
MKRPQLKDPAVTLSIRISPKTRNQLENLSDATRRTKSFLAAEAITHYLAVQAWQIKAIKEAVKKANSDQAHFISHDKMTDWLNSWGTENELEPPE